MSDDRCYGFTGIYRTRKSSCTTCTSTAGTQVPPRRNISFLVDETSRMNQSQQQNIINVNKVDCPVPSSVETGRRTFVSSLIVTTSIIGVTTLSESANAYYAKSFPLELQVTDEKQSDARSRKVNEIINNEQQKIKRTRSLTGNKIISSTLWGGALWFLSGSRSNPVATPLANLLYKKDSEKWLQERNDGYFAALPWEFLIILAIVFAGFGYMFDTLVVAITTSSSDPNASVATGIDLSTISTTTTAISLQLACVSLIGGGSFELGRIASGGKGQTKDERIRSNQLQEEFEKFVTERLIVTASMTKNVHRSEIIAAFRRYYSKYRVRPEDQGNIQQQQKQQLDNDIIQEQNVTDLEIERLIRNWARNQAGVDMTSTGFFYGVGINRDADIFVNR